MLILNKVQFDQWRTTSRLPQQEESNVGSTSMAFDGFALTSKFQVTYMYLDNYMYNVPTAKGYFYRVPGRISFFPPLLLCDIYYVNIMSTKYWRSTKLRIVVYFAVYTWNGEHVYEGSGNGSYN